MRRLIGLIIVTMALCSCQSVQRDIPENYTPTLPLLSLSGEHAGLPQFDHQTGPVPYFDHKTGPAPDFRR